MEAIATQRRGSYNIGLTIDGQVTVPLEYGDELKIRKSSRQFYMIRMKSRNYYKLLREKLGWGIHTRED
jgi:NAD kinase